MKKLFLIILGALLAMSAYVRLTQPEQQTDRPVLYWKSDPNPQRYDQIDLFQQWLVKHGHIDGKGRAVVEVRLDSANTQSKLIQAVSGVGGDLMDCDVPEFQLMGVLTDLTEDGEGLGFGLDHTYPGLGDLLAVDSRLYGYPCNVNVVGLWGNVGTFRKYGMPPPPEVWDPDTFERIGKEFVQRANAGKRHREVFFTENPTGGWVGDRFLVTMYRSRGLDDFNETRTRCILNDPRYIAVLKRVYKWTFEDHLFPTAAEESSMSAEAGYGGSKLSQLQHGRYAMIAIGRWCLIRIREFEDPPELCLSRFPQSAEFPNMVISARRAALYAGSRHKHYARLFFAYLAGEEYNHYIVKGADGLPPNPAYAFGNPAFERPKQYPNEANTSAIELGWARNLAMSMPYCRYARATTAKWKKYGVEMLFNDKGTAEEAAEEIENRINAVIERTVEENPALRVGYENDLKLQAKIDARKAAGKKLPATWIKNPFYLAYYRARGMIRETPDRVNPE